LPRFSIAGLLVISTLCAISVGWYVDRQRLQKQIPVPVERNVISYELKNAAPNLFATKIMELFDETNAFPIKNTNSVAIMTSAKNHDKIKYISRYLDRKGTNMINDRELSAREWIAQVSGASLDEVPRSMNELLDTDDTVGVSEFFKQLEEESETKVK